MLPSLNQNQRRVLGVLIEKSLAQPAYYPMTLNAIVAACNQKSARDPVMELDEDTVWNTLEELRKASLVTRLMPSGTSRTDRFRQETKEVFGWEKPQRAVLAELLLRGPQTIGELRQHCERMYVFENTEAVAAVLDSLRQLTPPVVAILPRGPGQSADRFAHLFAPIERQGSNSSTPVRSQASSSDPAPGVRAVSMDGTHAATLGPAAHVDPALAQRLAAFEKELAALSARVAALEQRQGH